MKRLGEMLFALLAVAALGLVLRSALDKADDDNAAAAAAATRLPLRCWLSEYRDDQGHRHRLLLTRKETPRGVVEFVMEIPTLLDEPLVSTAAYVEGSQFGFRNSMGRFQGNDIGAFAVLTRGEGFYHGQTEVESQYYCEPVAGWPEIDH